MNKYISVRKLQLCKIYRHESVFDKRHTNYLAIQKYNLSALNVKGKYIPSLFYAVTYNLTSSISEIFL